MNSAEEYTKTQANWHIWGEHPVERVVEHHRTILEGSVRYFFVKVEQRAYSEPLDLKLLNALWERRSQFLTKDGWSDRLYTDNGGICFSVWNDPYWETVYRRQGKHYPKPRKRKSKMRMSKKWREYV